MGVPTPFKKCFIFPNSVDGVTPKRKKTMFPAVVSIGKYREFYTKEANKKMLPKKKKNKVLSPTKESSESDISVAYEEDEDKNELDFEENEDLILEDGKYVIVSYEENYYPGVILKKNLLGAEISSMTNAGLGVWKWPGKPDILYYFKEDIVCSIKPPKLKNSRGHCSVHEMEKY
ncbi:hypothetical protein RN001_004131 [Aquatica leii]|uniref:Uncharacterized protein n=1 Tax=Aquatica leii TaxID=1421715 RepID=A0AAN7PH19_9COLE|nr:hypothetical protein RN001_004131 [Aquatica leii]